MSIHPNDVCSILSVSFNFDRRRHFQGLAKLFLMITAATFVALASTNMAAADDASQLRLVPFPKKIELTQGTFDLNRPLILQADPAVARPAMRMIAAEMKRAGLPQPKFDPQTTDKFALRLAADTKAKAPQIALRANPTSEDYTMAISPAAIVCKAGSAQGLFHATQTLCQLIRANRRDGGLPCLSIQDWPSLRWRCFQDDMTRGPSPKMKALKHEVALGAHFKMNLFTYYMEYQYAFKKHPLIGPKDGSLRPQELSELVKFSKRLHVDVLGNQQSFGHFARILRHEAYKHLREDSSLLCPVKEESYGFLDDLYSEICPLLPFEMFNVCCDETYGLGKGPSKQLADKIGVGGVYVRHVRRVHDLLKDKYNKRMMMWGDIILKHPDKLDQVPKDMVMLTWYYEPLPNFDKKILPFARSGYEFFVCPGISNWSRILPDFNKAAINIHNFVRDGAKHGAIGMLNTAWEDDGEALGGYKWHGYAWGAECAWNASTTSQDDFDRRIGAVLFGESGDHFGQAVKLLAKTHKLPGMHGMNNKRFWQNDFPPAGDAQAVRDSAQQLLEIVRPAIRHLQACRKEATLNAQLLDYFLFGARRMELIGQRMLDGLEFKSLYARAQKTPGKEALPLLEKARSLVSKNRSAHRRLGKQFEKLWLAESKPYALDWTSKRYATLDDRYAALLAKIEKSQKAANAGEPLPAL